MKMNNKFKGIFPALLTPFTLDGKINKSALKALIEMNLSKGVKGFYVGGSTAEVFLLSDEERYELYDTVKEIVGDRCVLIGHIGCLSTKKAIEFAKYTESIGYDLISSVAPFYYKFSFEEIKKYYFDIAGAVNTPMIVYNFPGFSGVDLHADQIEEFLSNKRFIGLKHTSSDFFALEEIKRRFPDKYVYNGYDEMFLSGMAMGADGAIGSTFNFMAEKFVKMYDLCSAGNFADARKIQAEANHIIKILIQVGVLAGEKAVLELMGIPFGKCREPFISATDEQIGLIKKEILPYLI